MSRWNRQVGIVLRGSAARGTGGVWVAVLCGILLAAGCMSPASRIRRHPELFASFPPAVQENVRAGRIELGYDTNMVYLALGRPNRTYTRLADTGTTTIWSYTRRYHTSNWQPVETVRVYVDKHGRRRYAPDWTWVDTGGYTEYEALRVEFDEDKVKAIEVQESPPSGG